jgi:hypothetical protein
MLSLASVNEEPVMQVRQAVRVQPCFRQEMWAVVLPWFFRTGGIAKSGTTERLPEIEGIRVSHLICALRGWPPVGERSFTVTHSSCLAAGALASHRLLARNYFSSYFPSGLTSSASFI